MLVGVEDPFPAGEGTDHHQQTRLWQMEVGQQLVYDAEFVSGKDEHVRLKLARLQQFVFTGRAARGSAPQRGLLSSILECAKDRKSTRLNSSHLVISYAVFCLKKKKKKRVGDILKL